MFDQSLADTQSDIRVEHAHLVPFVSNYYSVALQQLTQSYQARRPAAILVSDGRFGPSHVIDNFLAGIDDDVTVAQISGCGSDSATVMGEIVRGIGFDPGDMNLTDLENVLDMFLRYQKKHKLRTVISIQDSEAHGWWVLDKVRRLIELEVKEKCGLMIILSGPPGMIPVLNEPVLNVITAEAGNRIVLSPFTLQETRDFVHQRAESAGAEIDNGNDADQIFEFFAVTLIHELCSGIPDDVNELCNKCIELVDGCGGMQVSTDTVKTAARLIGLDSEDSGTADNLPVLGVEDETAPPGRLVAKTDGEPDQEILLDQNCILIGRDRLCSISITGLRVSRYHALVAISANGLQLVDLGSTNGTKVNGQKIKRCTLQENDAITIGHTRITYLAGSEQNAWAVDIDRTDSFEVSDPKPPEPSITYLGKDLHLLRTS